MLTSSRAETTNTKDAISFKGKVVFNPMEGGFWGVVTDSGDRLDGTFPKILQKQGLRVIGKYKIRKGIYTIRMWGQPVEFIEIKRE